ncbi:MAG: YihY family inner membrane protein [Burkholderiaceae bacterium]|nr:YihY family inner membrane protein [Burkholderiaceae bacterium]
MSPSPPMQPLVQELLKFPWRNTLLTLRERFREDQLGLTASSLTFTTTIALVPFFTVALAIFTAFPLFSTFQDVLQRWLVTSLIPDSIARQVLGYLGQFSSKASRLGSVGLAVLLFSTLALILTIDRTLNAIWRVKRRRPLAQRVLIYWSAVTLGPLLVGASLALTSWFISSSRGLVGDVPGFIRFLFELVGIAVLATGASLTFRYVPNTHVRWRHATAGGVFVALGIEAAKKLLQLYLNMVPTYSMVYGAFATVPIMLVWIYVAWVIVLLGAVIAAYLPSLMAGIARRGTPHGWQFQLAVEVLQALHGARKETFKGLTLVELSQQLRIDALQLEPALGTLITLDWVGQLTLAQGSGEPRFVFIADPETTLLEPLMQQLLLDKAEAVLPFWDKAHWAQLRLGDVLKA